MKPSVASTEKASVVKDDMLAACPFRRRRSDSRILHPRFLQRWWKPHHEELANLPRIPTVFSADRAQARFLSFLDGCDCKDNKTKGCHGFTLYAWEQEGREETTRTIDPNQVKTKQLVLQAIQADKWNVCYVGNTIDRRQITEIISDSVNLDSFTPHGQLLASHIGLANDTGLFIPGPARVMTGCASLEKIMIGSTHEERRNETPTKN